MWPTNVEPPLTDLPIPDLTAWATGEGARDPWGPRYLAAKQHWERR